MIIKSHIRGGFRDAAAYLKEQGRNELTRLVEISDPQAKDLDDAFRAMWAVSASTKVKKPLHHVSINPMKDERLTDEEVMRICKRLEKKYGYAHGEHQRVIIEHVKDGRQHFHVMWCRVNFTTGKPHYPYLHKKQSKIAAREMESELGLKKPMSLRNKFEKNRGSIIIRKTNLTGIFSRRYAKLVEPDQVPKTRRSKKKGGKSEGGAGGAVSAASAFKITKKETASRISKPVDRKSRHSGPNRRRRKMWVPVERRSY